jgi:Pyruvate/2-oxoacid:ferredoxin oxidoreductase gamma subunit
VIDRVPELDPSLTVVGVPLTEIALDLGRRVVKNVVALGALQACTRIFPEETFLVALDHHLGRRRDPEVSRVNREAFERGQAASAGRPAVT